MKLIGRVTSIKNINTATVLVEGKKTHHLYKKSSLYSKKYLADDQLGVQLGDVVEIVSTRPLSKNKFWKINQVIGRNIEAIVEEELKEKAAEAIEEVMPEEEESSADSHQSPDEEVKVDEKKSRKRKGKKSDS